MLVLGVAQIFEPANGYQLRRELLSWQVDDWAHVNPGSIYSMLTTLTRQGMLDRADLPARDGSRPVAVYSTTPAGRQELLHLIRAGIATLSTFDQTGLYAALSLMTGLFTRSDSIDLLERRIARLADAESTIAAEAAETERLGHAPPHVSRLILFSGALAAAEAEWLRSFVAEVKSGSFIFLGEAALNEWKPVANDPAWKMAAEREAYLAQLGRG
jgi:DNA-binding PadR family transcriptional regulator